MRLYVVGWNEAQNLAVCKRINWPSKPGVLDEICIDADSPIIITAVWHNLPKRRIEVHFDETEETLRRFMKEHGFKVELDLHPPKKNKKKR